MDIKIGADEVILWLRKNENAVAVENPSAGRRIYGLICKRCGGKKIRHSLPSCWPIILKNKKISKKKLPQTSAQYMINVDNIPKLFSELNKW
jgi:hypothetical protein